MSTWTEADNASSNTTRKNPVWEVFNFGEFNRTGYDTVQFQDGLTLYSAGFALNELGTESNLGSIGLGNSVEKIESCIEPYDNVFR